MVRREDDLRVSQFKKRWSSLCDKILESMEERERRNHEYLNGAFSSSLRIMNIDLNELPISGSETDDEKESEAKRRDYQVPNGASASTASFWLHNNIDLNKPPCICEREEPHNPERCSLSLLGDHIISKNLQNPSSRKRPLVREGRNSGRLNKPKKRRLDATLEVEDAKLIFKKTLSKSDVNRGQSRFLIPFKKLERNDFLTQVESSFLEQEKDKEGEKPGVGAILVNQRSETWGLVFKRWVMKKKKKDSQNGTLNYVLNCGWNDIVKGNGLKAKDKISLWSFRCDGVLCFALFTHPPTIGTA